MRVERRSDGYLVEAREEMVEDARGCGEESLQASDSFIFKTIMLRTGPWGLGLRRLIRRS